MLMMMIVMVTKGKSNSPSVVSFRLRGGVFFFFLTRQD